MKKIFGYEKEKAEIAQLREMLHNIERYKECGVRIPRGLILSGEPGIGKTVLARSMADEGVNLIELRASDCCEDTAAEDVNNVFEIAKNNTPAVVLLDELDKIAGLSGAYYIKNNDSVSKTLLQELDDLTEEDDIIVVATCNDIDCINEALLRPGRFDRHLHMVAPDEKTRKLILKSYFESIKVKKELDYDYLAKITLGYTGARLECLVNECGIIAMQKEPHTITQEDVRQVMNKLEFGCLERDPFEDEEELKKVAVHEAGHATVALMLSPDCIFGASVQPQGNANGFIHYIQDSEKAIGVKDIETEAAILLAGHVAERIVYNEYFEGSINDIERAAQSLHFSTTSIAAYGYKYVLNGMVRRMDAMASNEMKTGAAQVVEGKMEEADRLAERIIKENMNVFNSIVDALVKKKRLSREELLSMLDSQYKLVA